MANNSSSTTIIKMVTVGTLAGILMVSAPTADSSAVTQGDREFIQHASQIGLAEIGAGLVAADSATNAIVREYARHMIADHLATSLKLEAIAKAKGISLPENPTIKDQAVLRGLQVEPQSTFDQFYFDNFGLEKHRETLSAYAKHASETSDPDLRAFVKETLPKLRRHVEMARELQRALNT